MYGEQRLKYVTPGTEKAEHHPGELAIKHAQQRAFYEIAAFYAGDCAELMDLISEQIKSDSFIGGTAYDLLEQASPGASAKVGDRMDVLIAESAELSSRLGMLGWVSYRDR